MISVVVTPTIPTMHSMTVHDINVCLIVRLKYSLNIQNPMSLKCDHMMLPDPVAITINSGDVPVC